jgi:hypothetical protein
VHAPEARSVLLSGRTGPRGFHQPVRETFGSSRERYFVEDDGRIS